MENLKPITYVYKKIKSEDTNLRFPKIDERIAKEYRPTVIYIDKIYSVAELDDMYTERIETIDGVEHEIYHDPYEYNGIICDEYSNFDKLVNQLKKGDYIALDKFTDFSWDWSSLVYHLSLLGKDGATFSAYNIYFDNLEDILKTMQLGEDNNLPFEEKYIKLLLKIYKHYHKHQEILRNFPRMENAI